ncbi:MAG: DNA repair exonuclease [Thermoleophilia bacterium]
MRILHLADVHLDRPFVGLDQVAARARRAGLFDAFRRCLDLARERQVDLVTIGGDLWEEEHVRPDTLRSVAFELGRLDVPVLVVCGNHDPLVPGGSHRRAPWPENATLVGSAALERHDVGDATTLWARSWGAGDLPAGWLGEARAPADGRTHLLLVHGTAATVPLFAEGAHGPFDPHALRRAGFSLVLAGHIHLMQHVDGVVYPGSPEPLAWDEAGAHGAAVVEVADGVVSVELVEVARTRVELRALDCRGAGSSSELQARIELALPDAETATRTYLRLRLAGAVDPVCTVDAGRIRAELAPRFAGVVVEDATTVAIDLDARAQRRTLDGAFVRAVRERLDRAGTEEERRRLELALEAGLAAIDGREVVHVD